MGKKTKWSLKHCSVVLSNRITEQEIVLSGFTEEAIQAEWMGGKYEDIEQSPDGEHFEEYATNEKRMKITYALYQGTENSAILDEIWDLDTDDDDWDILIRNTRINREIKCVEASLHNVGLYYMQHPK